MEKLKNILQDLWMTIDIFIIEPVFDTLVNTWNEV